MGCICAGFRLCQRGRRLLCRHGGGHIPVQATIFLISGIFPLVPGAGIYWTVYYLVTEQLGLAVYTGYEAVKAAVAIVLGIVFVFELPQGLFRCMAKAFVKIPSCRPFGEKSG